MTYQRAPNHTRDVRRVRRADGSKATNTTTKFMTAENGDRSDFSRCHRPDDTCTLNLHFTKRPLHSHLNHYSTMSLTPAEQNVRKLARLPGNSKCPNCGTTKKFGFSTVCIKYHTFVCNNCKSSHQVRNFPHFLRL